MQAASAVFGGALCLTIARWPVSFWSKNRNLFVGGGFVLQFAVLMFGTEYGGNRNWLDIGFLSFQPSEFLKLAVIVWFASWIHDNEFMLDEPLQRCGSTAALGGSTDRNGRSGAVTWGPQ